MFIIATMYPYPAKQKKKEEKKVVAKIKDF
jgi:hypothetical protein